VEFKVFRYFCKKLRLGPIMSKMNPIDTFSDSDILFFALVIRTKQILQLWLGNSMMTITVHVAEN